MAEAKPPSTSDLLLLIAGLQMLKNPDVKAVSGEDYYLNERKLTEERTLRETKWNVDFLGIPRAAWDDVRFRDWLIATLFGKIAGNKQEFTAISEPILSSKDLLAKTFTPHMAGGTDAIKEALITKSHRERSFFSTLTFGISKQKVGTREVFLLGAGMRRRVELWLTNEEALQVDVEFFVPFHILPNHNHDPKISSSFVRSLCAGIAVKNTKRSLGIDEGKDIVAARFNLRIPFKAEVKPIIKTELEELHTEFGPPEISIEKKVKDGGAWVTFNGWKEFLEKFCEKTEVGELLNSPIGPLLAEKITDESGITDIFLRQSKRDDIKKNIERAREDLNDTLRLLENILKWQPPDKKTGDEPHSGSRKLGNLLTSLGFMTSKSAGEGEFEYTFGIAKELTIWSVVHRILDELDGFPVYVSELASKNDSDKRIAVSLASQSNPNPLNKNSYLGLAGAAYNIVLNPVSEKDSKSKKSDPDNPSIVLTDDNFTDDESIIIHDEDEGGDTEVKKNRVEVVLQLGKWFSDESLDDNWLARLLPKSEAPGKQRIPLPGFRFLPVKRIPSEDHSKATFSWTLLFDLLSLGVDIRGTTTDGLKFVQGIGGYFGLGAVEVRLALKLSLEDVNKQKDFFDRVAIGIGVKFKDLRLSLGPKPDDEPKKGSGDQVVDALQDLLGDKWVVEPETKPTKRTVKTRLTAKKKDKFSISVGYLTPLKKGSAGTLDIQLYDDKGNRGKMAVFAIDRSSGPIYLKQIGIGLEGVENLELGNRLPDSAKLTVSLTGGLRLPVFELGFIGAKLIFQLNSLKDITYGLDGLDVSVKFGSVIISGSFMKAGIEYVGSLTVSIPKGSFSAMGFYGNILAFELEREPEMRNVLNLGRVPDKLCKKLAEQKIIPAGSMPVRRVFGGGWELQTLDKKQYLITEDKAKLIVQSPEKTFFIYVTLSAAAGTGITVGPIMFTGIVFGYGYNRRMKVPAIDDIADFPLVKIVMGEGGYQEEDETRELHNQLAKPIEDPVSVLEKMKDHLIPELGQQFACGGVRFTISGTVDCFALVVVQWGGGQFEISLLGLARFRQPRDTAAKAICYVELQILMTIKPSEGTFKLQALLSNNSWIFNKDCKLTGSFAVFVWFGEEHKNDRVITLGGYHPRFRRPEHYPIMPRLGFNWPVNENLSIKGGVYLAYTPSCGMFGSTLEAYFHSGRISVWFTAHIDVILNWSPIFYEAEVGVSLRVEAAFFVTSLSVTIGVTMQVWGLPFGGTAHVDLLVCSFDIEFGEKRPQKLELIDTWQEFCHNFLNLNGPDRRSVTDPVLAFPVLQPNLAAGQNNLNNLPNARRAQSEPKAEDHVWKVRADELELAAAAAVPVTSLNVGRVTTKSQSEGIQARDTSGRSMMVANPVKLESNGLYTKTSAAKIGVRPMGKDLESVLNVTVIREVGSLTQAIELTDWTVQAEIGGLPAALWESGVPDKNPSEPSAQLLEGCITGIKRLKPPRGTLGNKTSPKIEWHQLPAGSVVKSSATQKKPTAGTSRDIQPIVAQNQDEQKKIVRALLAVGVSLAWQQVPSHDVRFRELQAEPLLGAVAA